MIPVTEYLSTTYCPDRDYLDGELKERNMGEQPHARLQMILGRIFAVRRRDWSIRVLAEQRIQTSAEHFRIADVCLLRSSDPRIQSCALPRFSASRFSARTIRSASCRSVSTITPGSELRIFVRLIHVSASDMSSARTALNGRTTVSCGSPGLQLK